MVVTKMQGLKHTKRVLYHGDLLTSGSKQLKKKNYVLRTQLYEKLYVNWKVLLLFILK